MRNEFFHELISSASDIRHDPLTSKEAAAAAAKEKDLSTAFAGGAEWHGGADHVAAEVHAPIY
jgi:hypothetical protein